MLTFVVKKKIIKTEKQKTTSETKNKRLEAQVLVLTFPKISLEGSKVFLVFFFFIIFLRTN